MPLKFTHENKTPSERCRSALLSICQDQYDDSSDKQIFEIDCIQFQQISSDTEEDSYGDSVYFAIFDSPVGLWKMTTSSNSYDSEFSIADLLPVRVENTPTYVYDIRK